MKYILFTAGLICLIWTPLIGVILICTAAILQALEPKQPKTETDKIVSDTRRIALWVAAIILCLVLWTVYLAHTRPI